MHSKPLRVHRWRNRYHRCSYFDYMGTSTQIPKITPYKRTEKPSGESSGAFLMLQALNPKNFCRASHGLPGHYVSRLGVARSLRSRSHPSNEAFAALTPQHHQHLGTASATQVRYAHTRSVAPLRGQPRQVPCLQLRGRHSQHTPRQAWLTSPVAPVAERPPPLPRDTKTT